MSPPPTVTLDAVEIKTTADSVRRSALISKIVVTQADLVRGGDATLAEALKRVPGVSVNPQGNGGLEIRLRGLGTGYVQILVDGDPVSTDFSIESISPEAVERVEIFNSGTAEMGSKGIAGTINIVMKKASRHRPSQLKLTVSENNIANSWRLDGQTSRDFGNVKGLIVGSAGIEDADEKTVTTLFGIDPASQEVMSWTTRQTTNSNIYTVSLLPSLNWKFDSRNELNVDFLLRSRQYKEFAVDKTVSDAGPAVAFPVNRQSVDLNLTNLKGSFSLKRETPSGAIIDVKASDTFVSRHVAVKLDSMDLADSALLNRTVNSQFSDNTGQFKGGVKMPFAADHAASFGWDATLNTRQESRFQIDQPLPGRVPYDKDQNYKIRVIQAAMFIQDEFELSPRLGGYLGLRWETVHTAIRGNDIASVSNSRAIASPIAQMLWKLPGTDKDQIRMSIGRTARAPTASELSPRRYVNNNNTATAPDEQGNPALQSEVAWGFDGAFEHYIGNNGSLLSLGVYERRVDNVIQKTLGQVDGVWLLMPQNVGTATLRGLSAEVKLGLRDLWAAAPLATVHASVARNWSWVHSLRAPHNHLASQDPLLVKAGIDYRVNAEFITAIDMQFAGRNDYRVSTNEVNFRLPQRNLQMSATWKPEHGATLRIVLDNPLHQDSVKGVTYHQAAGDLTQRAETRTNLVVRVTCETRF